MHSHHKQLEDWRGCGIHKGERYAAMLALLELGLCLLSACRPSQHLVAYG